MFTASYFILKLQTPANLSAKTLRKRGEYTKNGPKFVCHAFIINLNDFINYFHKFYHGTFGPFY